MTINNSVLLANKALILDIDRKLSIQEHPLVLPQDGSGQVLVPDDTALVRVRATGICGSDIHLWQHGSAVGTISTRPFVLGHECSGEIVAIGLCPGIFKKGDKVAIKPGMPCFQCYDCTTGKSNLCPKTRYNGTPNVDGACATYALIPIVQLALIPNSVSWSEAALIQPLAICVQMARQAELKASQKVVIMGAGCIGLSLGALAKLSGARKVVFLERQKHRVEFAKRYCADEAFKNPPRSEGETTGAYAIRVSNDILSKVEGLDRGFDVCIEASGAEECMQIGMKLCRPGGTYVQVGMYRGKQPEIDMMAICVKQLNIRGTIRYTTNCFEDAIHMIAQKSIDVASMISHKYQFSDGVLAFEALLKQQDLQGNPLIKVIVIDED